jgi:hypothetical protein
MALDKSIFDKYQKSLLNSKYVDLDDRSNIVYMDDVEVIKPMTSEEYSEMEGSIIRTITTENEYETSEGLIERTFASSSHTFTSFNNSVKSLMTTYNINNNSEFDFTNSTSTLSFVETAVMSSIGEISSADASLTAIFETLSDIVSLIPSMTSILLTAATALVEFTGGVLEVAGGVVGGVVKSAIGFGKNLWNGITGKGFGDIFGDIKDDFTGGYETGSSLTSSITGPVTDILNSAISMGQVAITNYSNWLSNTISLMSDTFTNVYKDGVTETKFGQKMEETWRLFVSGNNDRVIFETLYNPLTNLGTEPIIFGVPPRYTDSSDPRDRSYINTFIKDGNIMSIIPGKPKYNGLSLGKVNIEKRKDVNIFGWNVNKTLNYVNDDVNDAYGDSLSNLTSSETGYQTTAQQYADIALDYLKRNGISDVFNENDKRYYTFEQDYANYYSYLETMLNTIYTRMGLGENEEGKTKLFSFFSKPGGEQETLLERFNGRALGFYFEGNPSVAENMSNDTNDPSGIKATADAMSDEFQRINYVTGFGVKSARKAGIASARITKMAGGLASVLNGSLSGEAPFSSLSRSFGKFGSSLSGLAGFGDKMMGALSFTANTDLNAITESMLSTNGMKTQFPNLWTDSNYSKSINVEFEFISPYGDPLSIFQYCYVPLCSILALALPKQAEENGYVNPFFLRMDIPGVISSDFAIISNITWVRGGSNNLWTVDKHPRAISVSVTFEDLYAFLAMTKRVSYLSANPNYSMFLDSFSGIRSLYTEGNSINNDYWNLLVNRLNPNNTYADMLWNQTRVDKTIHEYLSNSVTPEQQFFRNYYKRDISWMKSR